MYIFDYKMFHQEASVETIKMKIYPIKEGKFRNFGKASRDFKQKATSASCTIKMQRYCSRQTSQNCKVQELDDASKSFPNGGCETIELDSEPSQAPLDYESVLGFPLVTILMRNQGTHVFETFTPGESDALQLPFPHANLHMLKIFQMWVGFGTISRYKW